MAECCCPPGLPRRDSDCGEFCYELVGEACLPAPFLEHRAVLVPGGPAVVEVALPLSNHQLEAAKRVFQVGCSGLGAPEAWAGRTACLKAAANTRQPFLNT